MTDPKLMIKLDRLAKAKTNHILHIILTVLTYGVWMPVWIIIAYNNAKKRDVLEKEINRL